MTLSTIFRSVLRPSTSLFSGYPTAEQSQKFLSERNSEFYSYGSQNHHKGKSKSDKKHAILSALSLLAFLFFLSILQNCIREQNTNRGTIMMFTSTGPTAPTGHQAKDPSQDLKSSENPLKKKRNTELSARNESQFIRKSRMLLSINESERNGSKRQMKFIRNFSSVNNWTKELSPISEKDLDEQKLKTLNFPLFWKNKRFTSTELQLTLPPKAVQSPFLRNQGVSQGSRRFKNRERISTTPEPMQMESLSLTMTQRNWDLKKPEKFRPSPYIPVKPKIDLHYNSVQNSTWQTKKNVTAASHIIPNEATTMNSTGSYVATTPRNRRSDYSTAHPGDYDDYERYNEPTRDEVPMAPTSAVGLDLNTFQTFPVHNYYNHRPTSYRENQTINLVTPEPTTPEIDRMHSEVVSVTTQQPLFHPTKTTPLHSKPFSYKYRNKYPNNYEYYHLKNHHPMESRYRFSPYRKTGVYEASHFHDHMHDDYYPPVVLAKYEVQHDEPGFDLMKFLWAMVTSFAKPLTKLVPSFAKDNHEETLCYDLLVCEAQRVSRFIGPTAEALATTVGTLLTWAATEETRQIVIDAINSGRENTCQQQIRDCEDRSGGKSTMTVIAQVMEMKLR